MTQALNSTGTLLKAGDGGGPETFTTIAEVLDIAGPSLEIGTEEVTSHDSAGIREFVATLLDYGEITFDVNWYAGATQTSLRTDAINKTKRNFQLDFANVGASDDVASFAGIITNFSFESPVEGVHKASVTIKISGAVTWG